MAAEGKRKKKKAMEECAHYRGERIETEKKCIEKKNWRRM